MSVLSRWRLAQALLGVCVLTLGCQPPPLSEDDVPIPSSNSDSVKAKQIVLILPSNDSSTFRQWELVCRQEAGVSKLLYRALRADTPKGQAELITKVLGEGVSGLVVVAEDPDRLTSVLDQAASKGVAIVLLDRKIPGLDGKATLVTTGKLAESVKELVSSTIEDAKKAGFPPEGPAVMLVNTTSDANAKARMALLAEAAKAAGLTLLPNIEFDSTPEEATKALASHFEKQPATAILFADDENGLLGSAAYRTALRPLGKYISAGFGSNDQVVTAVRQGEHTSYTELGSNLLAKRAIRAMTEKLQNKTQPDLIEVPVAIYRGPGREGVDEMILRGSEKTPPPTTAIDEPDNAPAAAPK